MTREPVKKTFRFRNVPRGRLETFKSGPSWDAVSDESSTFRTATTSEHTDRLAIARRQNRKTASEPQAPAAENPPAPEPSLGGWRRFLPFRKGKA